MENIINQKFTKLTVLEIFLAPAGKKNRTWAWCVCDCGHLKAVKVNQLQRGQTKSCGCWNGEATRQRNMKGKIPFAKKHPEYGGWQAMKRRCYYPKDIHFADYGGRGITVCDRWRNSFTNFIADMGSKPSPKHTLDRIDNNGNYELGNCRWATPTEQATNRRPNSRWL